MGDGMTYRRTGTSRLPARLKRALGLAPASDRNQRLGDVGSVLVTARALDDYLEHTRGTADARGLGETARRELTELLLDAHLTSTSDGRERWRARGDVDITCQVVRSGRLMLVTGLGSVRTRKTGTCPWFITPTAVREWAEIRGVRDLPDDGPQWKLFEKELMGIAEDAVGRKSPKRSGGNLLVYRVRKPVDAQLHVRRGSPCGGQAPAASAHHAGIQGTTTSLMGRNRAIWHPRELSTGRIRLNMAPSFDKV